MKIIAPVCAVVFLTVAAPAAATGTVRIQQHDDTVQIYTGVHMRIANRTLMLTSSDGVSTVVIRGASCDRSSQPIRCTGGEMSLKQNGATHLIRFKSATFYFNLTGEDEQMPLSTMKVGAHSVIFVAHTAKGTYITGQGTLDQEPSK